MNPYDILQVSSKADAQVIRAAYRSLMQRYHPDKNPDDAQAAQMSASLTQAYELLSDPQRKAALDAELLSQNAALRPSAAAPTKSASGARRSAVRAEPKSKPYALAIPIIGIVICIALVWGAVRSLSKNFSSSSPSQQLTDIRLQMESAQTSEAERRKLFALKQSLLEQHPDLAAAERAKRLDDLAVRSLALLPEPMTVNFSAATAASPNIRLLLPEITLVLGSFDAAKLQAHLQKHRSRIVGDLAQQLSNQPATLALSPDAEMRIKRAIRESVNASLEIRAQEAYPSTYFESPARHGVVDVILPKGFAAVP